MTYGKSSMLISMFLSKHPNLVFTRPEAQSITILDEGRRYPKNCSSGVLPPLACYFMMNGNSRLAESPNKQLGMLDSFSTIILGQGGVISSRSSKFNEEFEKIQASCILPDNCIICCSLTINCNVTLLVNIITMCAA